MLRARTESFAPSWLPESRQQSTAIIACTLRSGSNLLCELLGRANIGRPTEYFQEHKYLNDASIRSGAKLPSFTQAYRDFISTHDGSPWLGVKWNWTQFRTLIETLRRDHPDAQLHDLFPRPRWIKLERLDKVAQAVSLFVAQQTGIWVNGDVVKLDHRLEYDFDQIFLRLEEILCEELAWAKYFKESEISPLNLSYEELVDDPHGQYRRVLRSLGAAEDSERLKDARSGENLLNQRTSTSIQRTFAEKFHEDIARNRRPKRQRDVNGLSNVFGAILEKHSTDDIFNKFLDGTQGTYPHIRKLDISRDCELLGPIARVEEPHFIDGVGYRMDPGARIVIRAPARRLLIRLGMHPWSGELEVCVDGERRGMDLYHPVAASKPILEQWPETAPREVVLRPTGIANPLSLGAEAWLQQVWIMTA